MSGPFRVRVPATSANLGPGFDCLGLALDLWFDLGVEPAEPFGVDLGPGCEGLPTDETNLVARAMEHFARRIGRRLPPARLRLSSEIPIRRGLGSSAAAVVAGLVAAGALLALEGGGESGNWTERVDRARLVALAAELEGHPDNVAPAVLGGVVVSGWADQPGSAGESVLALRLPVPVEPGLLLVIPDRRVSTEAARAALPATVPLADAVFNAARASLLVSALAMGRLDLLPSATLDRLHQAIRLRLVPGLAAARQAALEAGALAVTVSGSGSSLLVWLDPDSPGAAKDVALAATAALAREGVGATWLATRLSPTGAHLA